MELMEFVLNSAVLKFQEEFFLQILGIFSTNLRKIFLQLLGIVMGTNLTPILANIYMAIFEEE